MKIRSSVAQIYVDRLTEKHDEANTRFSKHVCDKHLKMRMAL